MVYGTASVKVLQCYYSYTVSSTATVLQYTYVHTYIVDQSTNFKPLVQVTGSVTALGLQAYM